MTYFSLLILYVRILQAWSKLSGARQLTKENMKEPLKDIRRALLEADVRSAQ